MIPLFSGTGRSEINFSFFPEPKTEKRFSFKMVVSGRNLFLDSTSGLLLGRPDLNQKKIWMKKDFWMHLNAGIFFYSWSLIWLKEELELRIDFCPQTPGPIPDWIERSNRMKENLALGTLRGCPDAPGTRARAMERHLGRRITIFGVCWDACVGIQR